MAQTTKSPGNFYRVFIEDELQLHDALSFEEFGAYSRLRTEMYARRGPILGTVKHLSALWRCHTNKVQKLLPALLAAGVIVATSDDRISIPGVLADLTERGQLADRRTAAGRAAGLASAAAKAASRDEMDAGDPSGNGIGGTGLPSIPSGNPGGNLGGNPPSNPGGNLGVFPANYLNLNDPAQRLGNDFSQSTEKEKEPPKAPQGADEGDETKTAKRNRRKPLDREPEGFGLFWEAYPRRAGSNPRWPAAELFADAVERGISAEALIGAAKNYAAQQRKIGKVGTEYVMQAKAFLSKRDRDYEEYLPKVAESQEPATSLPKNLGPDELRAAVRMFKSSQGSRWLLARYNCPAPVDSGCLVPDYILAEFGYRGEPGITGTDTYRPGSNVAQFPGRRFA